MNAYYTYRDPKTFESLNREEAADSFDDGNSTHRSLATPRWFWHCRNCNNKGEVYDDNVLNEARN